MTEGILPDGVNVQPEVKQVVTAPEVNKVKPRTGFTAGEDADMMGSIKPREKSLGEKLLNLVGLGK